jgi:CRISPR-associated protein Cmr2
MTHLHFTFGPVQSFVAQARRTRDLYAGSFLLSHLSMAAMKAAQEEGGVVILPDYASLEKLTGEHAIAPNRFIAQFEDEAAATKAGALASEALQAAWEHIATIVWTRFVQPIADHGHDTREIWDRQISCFWEIAWAEGPENETDLLDRRKNWRTPRRTVEGGDHCTLMGQWQELSGFLFSKQRQQQTTFWKTLRDQSRVRDLDLEDDERLCAIALVKRFFPQVSKDAIGREIPMQNWPSTVSIAALPWQLTIRDNPKRHAQAKAYAELVAHEPGAIASSARRIPSLAAFTSAGKFNTISGNFLNRTALENPRSTPLNPTTQRKDLIKALRDLEHASHDQAGNHYALMLMDGDHMGTLIQKHGPQSVSNALTHFSKEVPILIEEHDGITIYAGGDDLLAMLPLTRALNAVRAVRELYKQSFKTLAESISATISAGLVFAHYKNAFSYVLHEAHHLLDDLAKDSAGRDAIAIGILKGSGLACRWVGIFDHFNSGPTHCFDPLLRAYRRGEDNEHAALSSSFLYNLGARFQELFEEAGYDISHLQKLLVAEYLHGRLSNDPAKAQQQRTEAEHLMQQLLHVCQQSSTAAPGGKRLSLDGARLIKFLALDGKEGAE